MGRAELPEQSKDITHLWMQSCNVGARVHLHVHLKPDTAHAASGKTPHNSIKR